MAVCRKLSSELEGSLEVGSAWLGVAIGRHTGRELGVHSKVSIGEVVECAWDLEDILADHTHMVDERTGLVGLAHAYSRESSLDLV